MNYTIDLSCLLCGGPLSHVVASKATPRYVHAICRCGGCGAEMQLQVGLSVINDPRFRPTPGSGTSRTSGVKRTRSAHTALSSCAVTTSGTPCTP